MKTQNSKGKRLNWTLLKDVEPVKLNKNLTKGKRLTDETWSSKNTSNGKQNFCLVP